MINIGECIKAHFIWTSDWLDDIVRENTDMIDDEIRGALEAIAIKIKTLMVEYNVTERDVEKFKNIDNCFVCNKKMEDKGELIMHGLSHIMTLIPKEKEKNITMFNMIVLWIRLYRDTMDITRRTIKVARRSDDIIDKNITRMSELFKSITEMN